MSAMKSEEELIWNYLDGNLKESERADFEQRLRQSETLQAQLDNLRQLHLDLAATPKPEPSGDFVRHVMERIKNPSPAFSKSLWLLGVIIAVTIIAAVLLGSGMFDATAHFSFDHLIQKQMPWNQSLPVINVNGRLLISTIIILNCALILMVFDRTILRPWFNRRMAH